MPELSVVVPVYHNEENLPDLFPALERVCAGIDYELVFVDDGSADRSLELLETYAARQPRAVVVKLSRNFGSFTACVAGLSHASGKAAVLISADLQEPPELIPQMLQRWRAGRQVVMAVRENREDPWLQRKLAGLYYRLMRRFALPAMPEGGFDCVLIDRRLIDIIVTIREKNTSLMGLILWLGFSREEIRYTRRARTKGRSMWTLTKKFKYFVDSFVAFSYAPLRLVQGTGLILAGTGFLYALLLAFLQLFHAVPIKGWTALMVATLVLGGVQMIMLGVIGEYLLRTLDETKLRPLFIVDRVMGVGHGRAEDLAAPRLPAAAR